MLRATLKSMLSRKRRLVLSTLAVVLGVMFVSGSFVLTDTLGRSFGGLFTTIYSETDIQVTKPTDAVSLAGFPVESQIPADRVPVVDQVPGVEQALGGVFVDGAKLLDRFGKVAPGSPGARFGAAWIGVNGGLVEIREGKAPTADNEIMISANLAKSTGYRVGDWVQVLTTLVPEKQAYRVSGITGYASGRETLAGETMVFFTEPVAQRLMIGATGAYSEITVDVTEGADLAEVRDRIAAALGDDYSVETGEELAAQSSDEVEEGLAYVNYVLLGFATIAAFVGIFIIINTFSITVAQRTRELALLRAIGASRDQVIGSVIVEAVVIGLLASAIGILLGVGVGALLASGLGSFLTGGSLPLAGLGVPPVAVILGFVVGLGVTLVAALLPALRAARIAPVAAMRDSATPDRPLTPVTVAGTAVLGAGAVSLALGLSGSLGGASVWAVLGGVLVCFVGVALLTPFIARPVVSTLGRVLSWGAAGGLGRRNSGRNPRRTAITASALMVSVALVTAVSLIFASIKASFVEALDVGFDANLVISAESFGPGLVQIDPVSLDAVRALPDVQLLVAQSLDFARVDGEDDFVAAMDDIDAAATMLRLEVTAGTLDLGPGQIVIDNESATERGLAVGDTVRVELVRTGEQTMLVAGIYEATPIASGIVVSAADAQAGFQVPAPFQAFVKLRPGADEPAVLEQVREAIADNPEVQAVTVDQYVAGQAQLFDIILGMIQLLLGLAMVIAVIGLVNTLALSMIERTREVGLLRAVGMRRRQIMWMVTTESVVISVFGALLGIAVGLGLGIAAFQPLKDQGLTTLALPWQLMAVYVVASVFVGLGAAFIPALSAARQNVLRAIAYE